MALSGLGPALSGAYANVQRLLLERKLQQEDLERRRQEALAERQAQQDWWMRQQQFVQQMRQQEAEAAQEKEKRDPWERINRIRALASLGIPGAITPDILADIEREMGGAPRFPRATSMPLETPPGVYQAPIKPVPVGGPKPHPTLGELGGEAIRPEIRHLPWDPSKSIPEQYFLPKPKEKESTIPVVIGGKTFNVTEQQAASLASAEASRAATEGTKPTMVTVKDPRTGKTVTIPATALPDFFRPYPRAGGATETLASMKADIIRRKKAGLPIAEWELRFAGIAFEKQPEEQNLAYLQREAQKTQIKVAGLRKRVDSIGIEGEVLEKARAALAEAEGEYEALRNAVTAAMQDRTGLPSLVPPATPGPFSLRGPGVSPAPSAPAPQRTAPSAIPGPRSVTTAELRLIAQRKGMTLDAVRKQAVKQGYTILP